MKIISRYSMPLSAVALLVLPLPQADGLSITLDFSGCATTGSWADLKNDGWGGGTTNSEKQVAAENVIRSAAAYWEAAYAGSSVDLSATIVVGWGSLAGSTLASGGASWFGGPTYEFASHSLTFDNDGSSTFFTDLTPWENSEWGKSSARDVDFGAGLINAERVFYNAPTTGAAFLNSDMLTISIHEIGHSLGLLGSYPLYAALDVGSDGDLDLFDGSQVAYTSGHLSYSLAPPESPGFPADGYSIGGTYYPAAMGSSLVTGTRKLLTATDILTLATVHGFDNVNTDPTISPVPEPAGIVLMLSAVLLAFARRRES
jgi:hypothetical protein